MGVVERISGVVGRMGLFNIINNSDTTVYSGVFFWIRKIKRKNDWRLAVGAVWGGAGEKEKVSAVMKVSGGSGGADSD